MKAKNVCSNGENSIVSGESFSLILHKYSQYLFCKGKKTSRGTRCKQGWKSPQSPLRACFCVFTCACAYKCT
jgi:hypothetical protein